MNKPLMTRRLEQRGQRLENLTTFTPFYHSLKPLGKEQRMEEQGNLSQWLKERCQREHLSLRQAAARAGVSHATIAGIHGS